MNFIILLFLSIGASNVYADVCSDLNSGIEPCRSVSGNNSIEELAEIFADQPAPDHEQAARLCKRKPLDRQAEKVCSNPWKAVCEPIMKKLSRGASPGVFGFGESLSGLQGRIASKVGSSRTGSNRSAIFNNLLNSDGGGPGAFQALGKKYPSIFSRTSSIPNLREDYLDYINLDRRKGVKTWNDYVISPEGDRALMKERDLEILRVTNDWRRKVKEIDVKFKTGNSAHVTPPGTPHWQAHQDLDAWREDQIAGINNKYKERIEKDSSDLEKEFLKSLRAFSHDGDAGTGLLVIASKLESVASPQSEPGDTFKRGEKDVRRESLGRIESMMKTDLNHIASNYGEHAAAIQSRASRLKTTTASSYLASQFHRQQESGKLSAAMNYMTHCGPNGMEKRAFYTRYQDSFGGHQEVIVLCPGLELAYEFEGPESVYGALAEASADFLTGQCFGTKTEECEPLQGLSEQERQFISAFQKSKFEGCDGIHRVNESMIVDRGVIGKMERGETLLRKKSDFFAGDLIGARLKSTYSDQRSQGEELIRNTILLQCSKDPNVINTLDNGDIRDFLGCAGSCGENLTCTGMGEPKVNDNLACQLSCGQGCTLSSGASQKNISIFNAEKGVPQTCVCPNGRSFAPMPEGFECPSGTHARSCETNGGSWCMTMSRGGGQALGLTCSSDTNLPCKQSLQPGGQSGRSVNCVQPEFVDMESLLSRYEASLNSCRAQSNAPIKKLKAIPMSLPNGPENGSGSGIRAD